MRVQCEGTCRNGSRCTYRSKNNTRFCGKHSEAPPLQDNTSKCEPCEEEQQKPNNEALRAELDRRVRLVSDLKGEVQRVKDQAAAEIQLQADQAKKKLARMQQQLTEAVKAAQAAKVAARTWAAAGAQSLPSPQTVVSIYKTLATEVVDQMQAKARQVQQEKRDASTSTATNPTNAWISPHPPAGIPKPSWCVELLLNKAFPLPDFIKSLCFSTYDFNSEDNHSVLGAKELAELGTYWASMSESYIYAPEKSSFWVRPRSLRQWIEWAKSGLYDSVRVVAHGCDPKSYNSIVAHPTGFDPFNHGKTQVYGYGTYTSLTTHTASQYTILKGGMDGKMGQMVLCLLLCKGDDMSFYPSRRSPIALANMQEPYYRYTYNTSKLMATYHCTPSGCSNWCDAVVVREGSLLLPLGVIVPK